MKWTEGAVSRTGLKERCGPEKEKGNEALVGRSKDRSFLKAPLQAQGVAAHSGADTVRALLGLKQTTCNAVLSRPRANQRTAPHSRWGGIKRHLALPCFV